MTVRFAAPLFPNGRHCLLSGSVTVGAVFPPVPPQVLWRWRLFPFGAHPPLDGRAKTEAAAKITLLEMWRDTIRQAELVQIERENTE